MPVPADPFLMIQNICPAETSFIVYEQVKLRGLGFRAFPSLPMPSPFKAAILNVYFPFVDVHFRMRVDSSE